MQRPSPAALLLAVVLGSNFTGAVCACAQTASAFEVIPRLEPPHRSHRAAYVCALAGAGLIGASFSLADAADRRYGEYLRETNPERIDARWRATVRADRTASGALLAGEALLAAGAYLRFLRAPDASRVALELGPSRCAIACSF